MISCFMELSHQSFLPPQFFPESEPFVAIMLAYLGNALTFLIRPFGGVFFAHIGDRIGRKKTLVLTLTMMGGGTMAIGLLPNYASIGLAALTLLFLCRIIQGLAIGGEWGGALLLAYEYAPKEKRGFFGAISQTGVTWGLLLGNFAILAALSASGPAFEAWVWRLPFIFSIVLVFIGLWIRKELDETPHFKQVKDSGKVEHNPLMATLRHHFPEVLIAIALKAVETAPFYIFATYMVQYTTVRLGYAKPTVLASILIGAGAASILIPLCGSLSDKIGRIKVYIIGVLLLAVTAFPYFMLIDTKNSFALIFATFLTLGFAWSFVTSTLGTMMSELFDASVRYTGITLGYQIGAALFSGTAPMLAVWMVAKANGHWWPIAIYIIALAVLSLAGISAAIYRKNQKTAESKQ